MLTACVTQGAAAGGSSSELVLSGVLEGRAHATRSEVRHSMIMTLAWGS